MPNYECRIKFVLVGLILFSADFICYKGDFNAKQGLRNS